MMAVGLVGRGGGEEGDDIVDFNSCCSKALPRIQSGTSCYSMSLVQRRSP